MLVDLTVRGALDIEAGDPRRARFRVTGRAVPSDPMVAQALDRVNGRKPQAAVSAMRAGKLKVAMLHDLAARGLLRQEQGKVLGLFPVTVWPAGEPGPEAAVLARVRHAALGRDVPDTPTAALVVLLSAAELLHKVVPDRPRRDLRRRAKEIGETAWVGQAVGRAVEQVVAGAQAAVIAATGAAAAAGGGA